MPEGGVLITMKPPIVVRQLAELLKRKPFQLIADLMELGVFANVNQSIDETVAQRLCAKHGFRFEVEKREKGAGQVHAPVKKVEVDLDDKPEDLKPRPPVVTIMGHVDHGKTTLLDCIRKSNVAAGEAGGITQHIGAYTISIPHPERPKEMKQITFLDTPGHAAFSAMRARGANVTDIVILVVAADDGVMPQTVEAIHHAQAAKVTIMVAVNKCDSPRANAMQVRQQMQEHGLVCEEWGGNTIFQDVSALTKNGVDKLLELLVLQADMLELKANPGRRAKGNVVESGLEPGGPTATVLIRKGTLRVGDIVLCGPYFGKARALINEEGNRLKEAGPSVAVKLLGISGVPEAGLEFSVVESEKSAREMAEQRAQEARMVEGENRPKVTLENLFQTLSSDAAKTMRVVVKGDTQGSVEAIVEALKKIESHKVQVEIIHSAVGTITESDALLASASKAIILGFHTRVDSSAAEAARREGVQIKLYSIIYELIDEVKDAMAGLLEPISKEVVIGLVEVKQVFALSKGSKVAGCAVQSGRMVRGRCRVVRRKDTIFQGTIGSLRRFQDEVSEVRAGMECGIRVDGFDDFQPGDLIESFTIEKVAQKL
jgi:translation initiation factor IF-2